MRTEKPVVPRDAGSSVLVLVVLKHDQRMALDERNKVLGQKAWWDRFPPDGCDVVAWYFAMGLGHVLVLSVPNEKIPALNVEIQRSCWGTYETDIYLSYDFQDMREQVAARESEGR